MKQVSQKVESHHKGQERDQMKTETISYLKKNAANLPLDEPMTITQNGIPAYVIESYAERHRRDEAIALLKLISFAKNDFNQGRTMSSATFKERLSTRKRNLDGGINHEQEESRN